MTLKKKHKCALGLGSESMLKKPNANWRSRTCRKLRKLFIASEYHPLIFVYLRSYPALIAERRRHLAGHRNVIHPLSIFSLVWKSLMILVNLGHIAVTSFHFCIITDSYIPTNDHIVLFILQVICGIDMILCFNTGFLENQSELIELRRGKIARAYVCSYFLPDVISWVPVAGFKLRFGDYEVSTMLIPDLLPIARLVRIITVVEDLKTLLRTVTTSHMWYMMVRHILLVTLAIHCFTCFLYVPSCFIFYVYGEVPEDYVGFLDSEKGPRNFYNVTTSMRYSKAMFVAVSAFFSTGFSMFLTVHSSEILVNSLIMLFGAMFKMYTLVFWMKTYITVYNSSLRYEELLDQVEKFMSHHQFPVPLMNRLRDYYRYHYQEDYYKESVALGYLSAQLQDEIRLHSYQILVDKVPVLQNLPPSFLGRVLGCLCHVVYMPDDLIYHVGDVSNYIYFICTGTLAVYTVKGVEALHFEDGGFVGGLALLTNATRRITTVVAIEITHTYRLSYDDLRELNELNPGLLMRIKEETYRHYTKISIIDELIFLQGPPSNRL